MFRILEYLTNLDLFHFWQICLNRLNAIFLSMRLGFKTLVKYFKSKYLGMGVT